MISAFTNIFKIPELRRRVLFTLAMIVIVRIGAAITMPGVNTYVLQEWFKSQAGTSEGSNMVTLFNLFSGGAMEKCALFSLGIMPYISASIIVQMLTAVIPRLGKLAKEDGGRQKIMQNTRYLSVGLCIFQGYLLAVALQHPGTNVFLPGITDTMDRVGVPLVADVGMGFRLMTVIAVTAGSMVLVWLGDQVTDRGIGNGVSIVITVNIVNSLPAALIQAWRTFVPSNGEGATLSPVVLVAMLGFLIVVIAGVICVTQAQRKIPVQYAKRVVGRKVYGGQTQYMPLKVNYAGVMPIIFAQAVLVFPSTIVSMAFPHSETASKFSAFLTNGWFYYCFIALMIFFFSYFWVAMQFQPTQIADDLKKYGGYIPGVRPGKPTADFLDHTMTRITFAGAVFLVLIALIPTIMQRFLNVPSIPASFFGGTSLLIIVGVLLDTMRQVETHLIQRHYDGFLRKGRLRGRFESRRSGGGDSVGEGAIVWLYVGLAVIVILGVSIYFAGLGTK